MPDLLKIGYSTKDPVLRAAELGGTGVPYPYVVEYDALVENPRAIEQDTHSILRDVHASKEFFKTDLVTAVQAIRNAISARKTIPLLETEGEEFKSLFRESVIERELLQELAPFPGALTKTSVINRPERRFFVGRSYAIGCVKCEHVYSIPQIYSDERGKADCPKCKTTNWTPS